MRDKKIIKRGLFEKKWKLCKILELKLFFYPYLFIYLFITLLFIMPHYMYCDQSN